jgi:hypothetical protein
MGSWAIGGAEDTEILSTHSQSRGGAAQVGAAAIFCLFWLRQVQDWKALNNAKIAIFLTRAHNRLIRPALDGLLDDHTRPPRPPRPGAGSTNSTPPSTPAPSSRT